MTDVMEDSTTDQRPDLFTIERSDEYEDYDPEVVIPNPDREFERVPDDDVPSHLSLSRDFDVYTYFYFTEEEGNPEGYSGRLSGRAIGWFRDEHFTMMPSDTAMNTRVFSQRVHEIGEAGGWSGAQTALVELCLVKHFLAPLAAGEIASEKEAAKLALAAIRGWWPEWDDKTSQANLTLLVREVYESEWRRLLPLSVSKIAAVALSDLNDNERYYIVQGINNLQASGQSFRNHRHRLDGFNRALEASGYPAPSSLPEHLRAMLQILFPDTPLAVPEDINAMSEAEVKEEFADYRARTQRTIEQMWVHAEAKRMCGEFDRIMLRCGWPARPKPYTIAYMIETVRPMTAQELLDHSSVRLRFEGVLDYVSTTRASKVTRLEKKPSFEEAAIHITAEDVAQYVSPPPESYTITVTDVQA